MENVQRTISISHISLYMSSHLHFILIPTLTRLYYLK